MSLRDLFNRQKTLQTSTVPDGTIAHRNYYGSWETHEHPQYFKACKTEQGGWNICQWGQTRNLWNQPEWIKREGERYLPLSKAVDFLLSQEIANLLKFGGLETPTSWEAIKEHIAENKFPKNNIFSFVKVHPEMLESLIGKWRQETQAANQKKLPPAPGA